MSAADPAPPWPPFEDSASKADILACFRLLLGRFPNPVEWPGHSGNAGQPLRAVVSSFLDSLEFSRRKLGVVGETESLEIADRDGFRIHASPDDLAVGRTVLRGSYEPEVAAVFRAVLRPGMRVVDVGANIGFFSMLAASLVGPGGSVLAFEPNPRNARMVEASRRLNGFEHVTVMQVAAGRAPGILALNTVFSNGVTSALDADGVLRATTVPCLPVDRVALPGPRVDLMKIDVEGAEYNTLLGAQEVLRRDRPVLVFEFGPEHLAGVSGVSGEVLLRWLVERGYGLEVIEQAGPPRAVGGDWAAVLRAYAERGNDHIDVVARPVPAGRRGWRGWLGRGAGPSG